MSIKTNILQYRNGCNELLVLFHWIIRGFQQKLEIQTLYAFIWRQEVSLLFLRCVHFSTAKSKHFLKLVFKKNKSLKKSIGYEGHLRWKKLVKIIQRTSFEAIFSILKNIISLYITKHTIIHIILNGGKHHRKG